MMKSVLVVVSALLVAQVGGWCADVRARRLINRAPGDEPMTISCENGCCMHAECSHSNSTIKVEVRCKIL